MKCPVCMEVELVMTERQAIEMDYCPQCRGVWLDRGELDKIVERSTALPLAQPQQAQAPLAQQPYTQQPAAGWHQPEPQQRLPESRSHSPRRDYDDDDDSYDPRKKKKRGGFLGELFDFD